MTFFSALEVSGWDQTHCQFYSTSWFVNRNLLNTSPQGNQLFLSQTLAEGKLQA
jgi:hypothetical protein